MPLLFCRVNRPPFLRACALGIAIAAGVTACGDDAKPRSNGAVSTAKPVRVTGTTVQLTNSRTASAGPAEVPLPDAARTQILAAIQAYTDKGIVASLLSAKTPDISNIFEPAVFTKLEPAELDILLDGAIGTATTVTGKTLTASITSLADQSGTFVLASVDIAIELSAVVKTKQVELKRSGSFVFAPDPTGNWKITGFDLTVHRAGPGLPRTPKRAASPTRVAR